MKLFNFDRVLCLSPHPDDVEYSMSGLIHKYKDTHFDILCMSIGGEHDTTSHPNRFDEVESFWKMMKCDNITLHFEYGFISRYKEPEWINMIGTKYLQGDPTSSVNCIILCSSHDVHFEHRIVNSIGIPLARKSKLSVIEYKSPSTNPEWIPNLFMELSPDILRKKVKSLQQFKTQLDAPYFSQENIPNFHIDFSATKRGAKYVELFRMVQLFS